MLGYKEEEYIGQPVSRFHKNYDAIREVFSGRAPIDTTENFEAGHLQKDYEKSQRDDHR